jgi:hypothetical protein
MDCVSLSELVAEVAAVGVVGVVALAMLIGEMLMMIFLSDQHIQR